MPNLDRPLLIKLRPTSALRAAESRANLRPLYDTPESTAAILGIGAEPQWFLADLPDAAALPWDTAHARVADQLGVAESDVVFAEPDIVHSIFQEEGQTVSGARLAAVGKDCKKIEQEEKNVAKGPGNAWHLGDEFSQLGKARDAVTFTDPRTRIGQLDTGYTPDHKTLPKGLPHLLERNFVDKDKDSTAADPDNRAFPGLDNSGHGTGTLSILAGRDDPEFGILLGGAPEAEVVPLRIADSVVLLRTSAFARALNY